SKGWLASAFMVLFAGVFALWGVNDIFRGSTSSNVAKVGGQDIPSNEYDNELRMALRSQSAQQKQNLTLDDARAMGLDKLVLDNIVDRTVLDQKMAKLGLAATYEAADKEIVSNENFHGPNGVFDHNIFLQQLQNLELGEQQFRDYEREEI